MTLQSVGVVMKNERRCTQRHSKVSESDGCPSGYAGRMGETVSAQRHSKVSEWLSKMAHRIHKTRITKNVLCGTGVQSVGVAVQNEYMPQTVRQTGVPGLSVSGKLL